MGANNLGATGAKLLMQAVAVHPKLQSLVLAFDASIGWQGLINIGKELPNTKLKQLGLDGILHAGLDPPSKLARKARAALIKGVQQSVTLTEFSFYGLDETTMEPIRCYLELNEMCRPLLRSDTVTPAMWPHILECFYRKYKISHLFFVLREQPWLMLMGPK